MVLIVGHYPDCNSGPPCLHMNEYMNEHDFWPLAGSQRPRHLCAYQKDFFKSVVFNRNSKVYIW